MRSYLIILTVILLAIVVNLPPRLQIGNLSLYRPRIDITLLGRRVYRDLSLKLGLDLSGGVHLAYQADTSALPESNRAAAVEATRANIERRINSLGVSEPIIQTSKTGSDYRLIVELAGISDINQATSLIGQTAQLEFRSTQVATPSSAADFVSTGLTGRDLQLAQVQFNGGQTAGQPVVSIEFSSEGTKKFAEITTKSIGKPLAIFLDDQLVTAPTVQSVISDGRAIISGNFTADEAKKYGIIDEIVTKSKSSNNK